MNARAKQGRLPLVQVQDGNVIFLFYTSYLSIHQNRTILCCYSWTDDEDSKLSTEEKHLNETFIKDSSIPPWLAGSGYVGLAAISTPPVPMIFPQIKWYLVLSAYVVAPLLAFCNSYGAGLTDWNLASTYGKIGLFIFASWFWSEWRRDCWLSCLRCYDVHRSHCI